MKWIQIAVLAVLATSAQAFADNSDLLVRVSDETGAVEIVNADNSVEAVAVATADEGLIFNAQYTTGCGCNAGAPPPPPPPSCCNTAAPYGYNTPPVYYAAPRPTIVYRQRYYRPYGGYVAPGYRYYGYRAW
jgi:hypothetical protein